ncbi:hypothetical protein WMY93_020418 [Mugilogobius chulae]|uniref:Complement C5 n=1 Tax=Mugilogobius chulae TaxID=88201 RepID=A0AAW0NH08_9GOBI
MSGVFGKLLLLLLFGWFYTEADAQDRTFLVAAPLSFRLDAVEKVVLQVFGFSDPVTVYVFVRKTMLFTEQVDDTMDHVILHVQSESFNQNIRVPLSRTNGFLLVQTDKPLYTPQQTVNVRAFSLNQELRPADRSVFLTFRDPDYEKVDVVEVKDVSNGMPSMQNPFKIPISPKLGIWTIEASYMEHFDTKASTTFEVREYVLPSFTIQIEPVDKTYISHNNFRSFDFKVSAKYLHGAPLAEGEMFLRYGYVSLKSSPVIIPSSIKRQLLTTEGEQVVSVNLEEVFSKHIGPKTLAELKDKYLYIAVLLREATGGISQEAEFASVKFVKSPYTLGLVSTPPFIKPGLPYNIQVLVKDHQGEPVSGVPVSLVSKKMHKSGTDPEDMSCSERATSSSEGIALIVCNIQERVLTVDLEFETDDDQLPRESQASLSLRAQSYESPNARYLYIEPTSVLASVGSHAQVTVYAENPPFVSAKSLNYLIMSKGKIMKYGWIPFRDRLGKRHTLSFQVTPDMVPSIRLLVYYMPYGERTAELVADAVWLNVPGECVNGLQTELTTRARHYEPKKNLEMQVKVSRDGFVAMTAVDTGIYSLRPNFKDPVDKVLRHFERADLGCGGGGGRNAADVFRLAGLSFITNANSGQAPTSEPCTAIVRPKRAVTEEDKAKILGKYRHQTVKDCCKLGFNHIPTYQTCEEFVNNSKQLAPLPRVCRNAIRDCCIFVQRKLNDDYSLGRADMGGDFEKAPTLVRSYFPESWLFKVRSAGTSSMSEQLPDSLTTWHIKTVGMFDNGICVAKTAKVSVNQPLSVDVPLPYQIVRGEQLQLSGSVYSQLSDPIKYCVTLTVGPELCLADSLPDSDDPKLRSTACREKTLSAGAVQAVKFTLMALEPGKHTLTFSLFENPNVERRGRIHLRLRDKLVKTLTVVPEGVLKEVMVGGRLDPRGLYGSAKMKVELKSALPQNIVPKTDVQRMLTINGEILDEWVSVVDNPEGLKKLLSLQDGTAASELGGVLPLLHVYNYLEITGRWHILGPNERTSSQQLKDRIKQGLTGVSSFRKKDFSYSMFMNKESSTWVTALAVQTLAMVNPVVPVDHESLAKSVNWLIHNAKHTDGSFRDKSLYKPNKIMALPDTSVEKSVYLTSFVIIALHKATTIETKELQLKGRFQYVNPIVTWLTQDQHYGGGYFSVQDTLMTLEAVTLYCHRVPRAELDQNILIRFSRESSLDRQVHLHKRAPVATPIRINKNSGVTASTAFGHGVSHVKLKTVYYQTVPQQENCNFDITLEIRKALPSEGLNSPHLVACARYKPPPNEVAEESLLTVMEIQLPTVPSSRSVCVGFRIRTAFVVGRASDVVFTVYEEQDQASKCTKLVSDQEQQIDRLCQFDQCLCITATCSLFRGTVDPTVTEKTLTGDICRAEVKYAFKVKVTNIVSEGDFLTYTATVVEAIKGQGEFDAVSVDSEVDFIKKTTCYTVDLQKGQQYLISGSSGLEVEHNQAYRFRFSLDSEAQVQVWPVDCGAECQELERFTLLAQLSC